MIIVDVKIAGTWKNKDNDGLGTDIFTPLNKTQSAALKQAEAEYPAFGEQMQVTAQILMPLS